MSMNCSFYLEKGNQNICMIKKGEINNQVFREYCKNDYSKNCPIYQYYLKEKNV